DDEVDVRSGRPPGAAYRPDDITLIDPLPHGDVRLLRHVAVDGRVAVLVIDLDVVAKTAVAPPGGHNNAAIGSDDRGVGRRGEIDAVGEVAANPRVIRLDREPGATVGLGERPAAADGIDERAGRARRWRRWRGRIGRAEEITERVAPHVPVVHLVPGITVVVEDGRPDDPDNRPRRDHTENLGADPATAADVDAIVVQRRGIVAHRQLD